MHGSCSNNVNIMEFHTFLTNLMFQYSPSKIVIVQYYLEQLYYLDLAASQFFFTVNTQTDWDPTLWAGQHLGTLNTQCVVHWVSFCHTSSKKLFFTTLLFVLDGLEPVMCILIIATFVINVEFKAIRSLWSEKVENCSLFRVSCADVAWSHSSLHH